MRIEITEKGSEAFYREAVSVTAQYRYLIKDHQYRLKDCFKSYRRLLILDGAALALMLFFVVRGKADHLVMLALGLLTAALAIGLAFYFRLESMYRAMLAENRPGALILDEEGVELVRGEGYRVRIGWENVVFVRSFQESLVFFSGGAPGLVITAARRHEDQILSWLRENRPGTEVVRDRT